MVYYQVVSVLLLCEFPCHVGLAGKSAADIAATTAILLPVWNVTIHHLDYNSLIRTQAVTTTFDNYILIILHSDYNSLIRTQAMTTTFDNCIRQ